MRESLRLNVCARVLLANVRVCFQLHELTALAGRRDTVMARRVELDRSAAPLGRREGLHSARRRRGGADALQGGGRGRRRVSAAVLRGAAGEDIRRGVAQASLRYLAKKRAPAARSFFFFFYFVLFFFFPEREMTLAQEGAVLRSS